MDDKADHYELVIDDGETETNRSFKSALAARRHFDEAVKRDVFSAAVYSYDGEGSAVRRLFHYEPYRGNDDRVRQALGEPNASEH